MTMLQAFSLALLVAAFAVAIWRNVNVGLVTIPAAYLLARMAHIASKQLYAGFPVKLFILVLGVMYLFGHAERSGALARVVMGAERLAGRRIWLLPWMGFILAAAISAMGALPGATVAIVMPITMKSAQRQGINPMLMGLVTLYGALAGGFSPISVFGILVRGLTHKEHYQIPSTSLFVSEFVLYTAIAVASFLIYKGYRLFAGEAAGLASRVVGPRVMPAGQARYASKAAVSERFVPRSPRGEVAQAAGSDTTVDGEHTVALGSSTPTAVDVDSEDVDSPLTADRAHPQLRPQAYELASLLAIAVFVLAVVFLGLDVGLTALGLGAILHIVFRLDDRRVIAELPWGVALILGGILTYVNVLLKVGTFTVIAHSLQTFHSVALSALLLTGFAALFSSFESSSVTVLAVSIPIVMKVDSTTPHNILFLVIVAVSFCAAAISTSPYHVNGALLIANGSGGNTGQGQVLFRKLLWWTVTAAIVLPVLTWLIPLVALVSS